MNLAVKSEKKGKVEEGEKFPDLIRQTLPPGHILKIWLSRCFSPQIKKRIYIKSCDYVPA